MKEAKRNAPAANYCTTGEKPWPLTPNQWLVYYWLLAHSKWNYGQREDHYFIYDNSYKDCFDNDIIFIEVKKK